MIFDSCKQSQSEKILIAASECISKKGYANVSMRDIANEAGVVLSQLNYYFSNKEGLFKEVVKMMTIKYLRDIEEALKTEESPKERLKQLIKYFRKMLQYNPKLFKLLYDFTGLALWSPVFSDLLSSLYNDLADLVENYILSNFQIIRSKGISVKSLSRLIIGSMFGIGVQVLIDHDEELTDALDAMQVLFE